ncbi:MAG: hypothetical protein U0794_14230 [Isosphaeraceae bacterium]
MNQVVITLEDAPESAITASEAAPEIPPNTPRTGHLRTVGRALRWLGRALASMFDWIFGAFALTLGLAILAAAPVAQFLCLGYLLEASARVARTGRLREAFIGVRKASRLGSIVIGVSVLWVLLQVVSSLALSAELVDPGGPAARRWRTLVVVSTVLAVVHAMGACARGGRVRHFLIPFGNPFRIYRRIRQGGAYAAARDGFAQFVASLHLGHYFRLGLLGFLGTLAWLVIPVSLLGAGRVNPLFGLIGALLLGLTVMPLPFLQVRFALSGKLGDLFALRSVRQHYRRAPWAFTLALFLTLIFAVPLYLLKIEIIPRETAWLPSLVFLAFIFPARILTGWAYGRSLRREPVRHWFFRWTGRLPLVPLAAFYVLIVFLSQYTAWRGVWSLYEQHAFLLPVPFLGL